VLYSGLFFIIWIAGNLYYVIFYAPDEEQGMYLIYAPIPGTVLGLIIGTLVSLLIDVAHQYLNAWSSAILGAAVSALVGPRPNNQ
jgi:hypothetical protein